MNVPSFFYIPGDPLQLPVHYSKAFGVGQMSYCVVVMVYGGWGPKVLLLSCPQWICQIPLYTPLGS